MILSRSAITDFLTREFDSYLWMKSLKAEQILYELRRMRVRPRFKTEPWLHQLVCFYIGLCRPEFLFLLDMGLGKSKIVLDLITQAQREKKLKHALVTVPRIINMDSWADDIERHSDLAPWLVNTRDTDEKWERLANPKGDVTVIDYQGLHWALSKTRKKGKGRTLIPDEDRIAHVQKVYNFIAPDEIHKLSNHQSLWFALMRRLTKHADYAYGTTGTLFGKDLEDIWAQFYLIDKGETFGENLGLFRGAFFTAVPNPWGRGEKFVYNKGMDSKLNQLLQHRSIRYDENEVLDLPPRVPRIEQFTMSDEQRTHYLRALEGFINSGDGIEELNAQWLRMRQISSGYLAWTDEHGPHTLRFKENPKLDGLERLLDEIGGRSKAVIAYDYTETGRMICERLEAMGIGFEWFYGGTPDKSASRRRFMEDRSCKVFVMNSAAGGTGNDGLQKVARYMFLYETPTSPRERQQVIKRIHRPGQAERTFIYDMVMRKSLDVGILADIKESRDTFDSVVNGKRRPGRGFFLQDWGGLSEYT